MNTNFSEAMRMATLSTRANDVVKATKIILLAVSGRAESHEGDDASSNSPFHPSNLRSTFGLLNADAEPAEASTERQLSSSTPNAAKPDRDFGAIDRSQHVRRPLGEVLRSLRGGQPASPAFPPSRGMKASSQPPAPHGAQFRTRSFKCAAGARDYKLYIPASAPDSPRGLVVMLHGCKQDPNDFAVGTDMNAIAESQGLLIAYPGQASAANSSSCWNWFNPAHQTRDAGEPSIIAELTRDIASKFGLDRRNVFIAGLSAGGAMAAVMGETYPELYAAVGIHSGLAYRSATDVGSAFVAMRGSVGLDSTELRNVVPKATRANPRIRTIVFHGSRDRTVHPSNADRIVEVARSRLAPGHSRLEATGVSAGRHYTRTIFSEQDGVPVVEIWRIDGAGHAWSGGSSNGSFADSRGPNASAEMTRFFLGKVATECGLP